MDNLSDVPIVGNALAAGGVFIDAMANGGQMFVDLATWFMVNAGAVLPMATTLDRLAERLAWLPADLIQHTVTWLLVVILVVNLIRLLEKR